MSDGVVSEARALVETVERSLDEVPLDADEQAEALRETGIDARRLAERVRERVEGARATPSENETTKAIRTARWAAEELERHRRRSRYGAPGYVACDIENAAWQAGKAIEALLALIDEQRARLDALAPLAEAAARVRETGKGAEAERADFKAADVAWVAQGRPGGPLFDARQAALKCSNATRFEHLRATDALLALVRGER